MLENVLIIFMKYPEPGLVKTRLAKDIGKQKASLLYRLFVEAVLKGTQDRRFARIIFYWPPEKKIQIRNWIGSDLEIYPQKGVDLGERLSHAFKFAFEKRAKRVIAIGTDCPTLESRVIVEAFRRLKDSSCVLGPALDGGYYLVGLSSFYPELFKGIPWGQNTVLEKTKDKIKNSGLKFSILKPYPDIDSLADLNLVKDKLLKNFRGEEDG